MCAIEQVVKLESLFSNLHRKHFPFVLYFLILTNLLLVVIN